MRSKTYAFAVALSATTLASPAGASLSGFARRASSRSRSGRPTSRARSGPTSRLAPQPRRAVADPDRRPPSPAPTVSPQPIEAADRPGGLLLPRRTRAARCDADGRRADTRTDSYRRLAPGRAGGRAESRRCCSASRGSARGAAPPHPQSQPAGRGAGCSAQRSPLAALAAAAGDRGAGRVARSGPMAVPQIERPRPFRAAAATSVRAARCRAAVAGPARALRLSLTLMNATLAYRLALANNGPALLTGLAIGADMISAHASMSRESSSPGRAPATARRRSESSGSSRRDPRGRG